MSRVFVDTSAVLALLIATDDAHPAARRAFSGLRAKRAGLITSSYVLVETYALLGRRFGPTLVRSFRDDFAPLFDVVWVDQDIQYKDIDLLLDHGVRDLSLVDATSFVIARKHRIARAFAFDRHFEMHGLEIIH